MVQQPQSHGGIGADVPRVDARLKVTGQALYASDHPFEHPVHAHLVTSPIARGRISRFDESAARAVPGVLDIYTHRNVGKAVRAGKTPLGTGYMGSSIAPLADARVHYPGQIVAMVLAESLEAAREAAGRLVVVFEQEPHSSTFGSSGAELLNATSTGGRDEHPAVGNAEQAIAEADVTIDSWYGTPVQHHNPMELFSTVASWSADGLTVWEGSQSVRGYQHGLALQLRMRPARIRVLSPFVGGAFGSRGMLGQHTALVALAAQRLGRPVKLTVTRSQGFTIVTYRAETRHHVRLGASRNGKLTALVHDGFELTSRHDQYTVSGVDSSTRLYACPNVSSSVSTVQVDRNTPGFMRAPAQLPYLFALESAMDELAHALAIDPVELRRRNDTQHEPIGGLPYTSRALMKCFDKGAHVFGWRDRDPQPRSQRDGEWLVGWGCASSMFPTHIAPASARVRLSRDGRATVQTGIHDVGTGASTVVAQTAAERLGVPVDRVSVELGDSRLPPGPMAADSSTTASVCTAVAMTCERIRAALSSASVLAPDSPHHGAHPDTLGLRDGALHGAGGASEPLSHLLERMGLETFEATADHVPRDCSPHVAGKVLLHWGVGMLTGGFSLKDRAQCAFGAQFVEVRVHARTCEVRVPRMVGVYAAGRIVNPRTARSQLMGGQIWGLSAALHEATEIDERTGRYYNDDFAGYLIPVHADVVDVQTLMLAEQDDDVNELGIKGLGELGCVGMNAAVANAVFHATGVRVRQLPIRLDKLL
jgi:xanthine dehydrogenase YagR molybdenum-binding subunit